MNPYLVWTFIALIALAIVAIIALRNWPKPAEQAEEFFKDKAADFRAAEERIEAEAKSVLRRAETRFGVQTPQPGTIGSAGSGGGGGAGLGSNGQGANQS